MNLALQEFRPLTPPKGKEAIKSVGTRLHIDKFQEHREAAEYLEELDIYGQGTRTLILALLHYRDSVVKPLEQLSRTVEFKDIPAELQIDRLAFTSVPEGLRSRPARIRNVSARLYVDRWMEHREANQFLQKQQKLYGNGGKTVVRALIHFKRLQEAS